MDPDTTKVDNVEATNHEGGGFDISARLINPPPSMQRRRFKQTLQSSLIREEWGMNPSSLKVGGSTLTFFIERIPRMGEMKDERMAAKIAAKKALEAAIDNRKRKSVIRTVAEVEYSLRIGRGGRGTEWKQEI